jgi:hypothetical protein
MRTIHVVAGLAALFVSAAPLQAQLRRDNRDQQDNRGQGRQLSAQEQQQRIAEQRQRDAQYQTHLRQQVVVAQQQADQMQRQRRNAQYAAQQQYLRNLQEQQQRLQAQRDYSRDPAFVTAPTYRYRRGNAYGQTNQYGVDVLKQAVNYGYQQGVQFGQADRRDGLRANYQNSYAYRDANYGYNGQYVSQSDYNYYFREGFRRGYTDGYNSQSQYGNYNNGSGSILGNILTGILGLQPIR